MDKKIPLLELQNMTRHYGEVRVLNGTNLTLNAGEAVAIIGPSGSGKSTLLHVAGLLDAPNGGQVRINGTAITATTDDARAALRNQQCGFIYQFHHLLREFTALENVLMPNQIGGKLNAAEATTRAQELLSSVGLAKRISHFPHQLSGGEQQRVAIARALMNRPALLLADEPTGNLDPHTAEEVTELLFNLISKEQMAALIVTHNPTLAARCHRVLHMHEGVLVEAAQPAKTPNPTKRKKAA